MICPNCGFENEIGTRFCRQCGKPQSEASQPYAPSQPAYSQPPYAPPQSAYSQPPYAPPQPAYNQPPYAPPQPAYNQPPYAPPGVQPEAPKKKGKTGLIIGICAGVLVIAVVLALVFLLPSGPKLEGDWVSEDDGIVLSLDKDGELTMYSLAGTADADYEYEKSDAAGSFKADGVDYEFTLDKDRLKLTNTDTDETIKLSRAEEEPDIEDIVTTPIMGLWINEDNGEVLEFKSGGDASTHTSDGDYTASFMFDVDSGEGMFKVLDYEYTFTCDKQTMTLEGIGPYQKVSDDFDVAAFVSEFGNPLAGIWYDPSGVYGTIEFFDDSTYTLIVYGVSTSGTYTYDSATGTGTLTYDYGDLGSFTYAEGTLALGSVYYTQDYVEQQTLPDYSAVVGDWYESTTGGSLSFYEDGTFNVFISGTYYYGTYTFDPISLTGTIFTDTNETLSFYISGDAVYLEGVAFTRDYTVASTGVEGYWYDLDGELGTIYFYSDGSVELYSSGIYIYGTYSYDASSGTGTLSLEYEGESYGSSFYTSDSLLVVDDVYYTRDYVEQPVY